MKQQLIENLEFLQKHTKEILFLSIQTDIPGKVILNMGRFINQSELTDLLDEFGNHAGLSYRISINKDNNLTIEIFIKN